MQKAILVLCLLVSVILLSLVSTRVWGGKPEKTDADRELTFQSDMTVATFGQVNHLANPTLKKIFGLESRQDLQKPVLSFGLTQEQLTRKVNQAMALHSEHERIRINRNTCIDCRACAKTCPSTVMTHILDRKKTVPDCFSCGACIEVCPTDSIRFGRCEKSQDKPT